MGAIDGHIREVLENYGHFDPDECMLCHLAVRQGHVELRHGQWVVREGWSPAFTADEARTASLSDG